MRLRYLHLRDYAPLQNVAITFGHESLLGRALAIRFVVGINGTGKTRLLQALTEAFLALGRQELPPFPVMLAYDLAPSEGQRRSLYLHAPQASGGAALVEFDGVLPETTEWAALAAVDWSDPAAAPFPVRNRFLGGDLPGGGALGAYLPAPLLVYTSGHTDAWRQQFAPRLAGLDDLLQESDLEGQEDERPVAWDAARERAYLVQSERLDEARQMRVPAPDELAALLRPPLYTLLVTAAQLPLAACAVTLDQARREWPTPPDQPPPNPALRELLDGLGWREPLALNLQVDLRPASLERAQARQLYRLFEAASVVRREPEPGDVYRLTFDLRRPVPDKTTPVVEDLFDVLGGENPTPFEVFRTLYTWQQDGLLRGLSLALRWGEIDDLLLYDWLSDGEQMFLGRIALFYLLQEQDDALLILDEPETHFNDFWKRQVVDILDTALGDRSSEVVISSHSSIALTDVFDTEVVLLQKVEGQTVVVETPIPTFGALPSEIMQRAFDAPNSIGQRAREFLDLLLLLAEYPDEITAMWTGAEAELPGEIAHFSERLRAQHSQADIPAPERLSAILRALRTYTQQTTERTDVTLVDTLTSLGERVGPSYYQFEIRRRIRALNQRDTDAASG